MCFLRMSHRDQLGYVGETLNSEIKEVLSKGVEDLDTLRD